MIDYQKKTQLRASAILTNDYVAGTTQADPYKYNQMMVYLSFTKGSTTSMEMKIEFSHDNSNWYQESMEDFFEGVGTVRELIHQIVSADQSSAQQNYRFPIPITDRYIKISVKATGVLTDSLCAVDSAFGVS